MARSKALRRKKLTREPKYVSRPLYALFVLDETGEFEVWAVLDRSRADVSYHDVLYLDTNGDGDLTAKKKRFQRDDREIMAKLANMGFDQKPPDLVLPVGVAKIAVPGTRTVHTGFQVTALGEGETKAVYFRIEWLGKVQVSCHDLRFWGTSPANAPVLRPTTQGPLTFRLDPRLRGDALLQRLAIGAKTRVAFYSAGSGPRTTSSASSTSTTSSRRETSSSRPSSQRTIEARRSGRGRRSRATAEASSTMTRSESPRVRSRARQSSASSWSPRRGRRPSPLTSKSNSREEATARSVKHGAITPP